jgi:transposase InsO family protein
VDERRGSSTLADHYSSSAPSEGSSAASILESRFMLPWLTIVIDDYSRAVAGYYLGFEPPSSLRTTLALRQGIWRKGNPHWEICGIPDILYTDNGSDFR